VQEGREEGRRAWHESGRSEGSITGHAEAWQAELNQGRGKSGRT
jgi:hypothetical protein